MRFQIIKVTAEEVSLVRLDKQPDGSTLKLELTNASRPLEPFATALQAFCGYACELVGAPHWHEDVRVSSIHLSEEPKTNRRGLIVTFVRRIERAKNRVFVGNTPLMHAPTDEQEGTNPGTFPREVAAMIAELETQATAYWNGEREQGEMFSGANAAPAKTKGAGHPQPEQPADELGARRGRRKTGSGAAPGELMNPDKTKPPTDKVLAELLQRAGKTVALDVIASWGSSDRAKAQAWADAKTDPTIAEKKIPPMPECVEKGASPQLLDQTADI